MSEQDLKNEQLLADVFGDYSVSADGKLYFFDGEEAKQIGSVRDLEGISNLELALGDFLPYLNQRFQERASNGKKVATQLSQL